MLSKNVEITRCSIGCEPKKLDDVVACEIHLKVYDDRGAIWETYCSPNFVKELVIGEYYLQEGEILSDDSLGLTSDGEGYMICRVRENKDNLMLHSFEKLEPKDEDYLSAMQTLLSSSEAYEQTGNMHGAGLFLGSELKYYAEDISRHNAILKVVGKSLVEGYQPNDMYLAITGRVHMQIVEMANEVGIDTIVSKAAPTDYAITYAKEHDIQIIGFVKDNRMNKY